MQAKGVAEKEKTMNLGTIINSLLLPAMSQCAEKEVER